ncbi:hypothetical protein SAMN07250955_105202 [Arboricoccus pini]|uniref:Enoyl reductase (ER) domain-containing protein n=1 Tax=Arboricoccus pini TaxID=1963835 RepID=A0A212R498_9PROT|nr:NADP-dependent oxidoreductase [Arboricoccus pini]SNB66848.1 hypothetical protein SAMN07250955_105202 [Arboricoccus pini]
MLHADRIVLAERPKGQPTPAAFRLEEFELPEPAAGEVLVRTLYLSLDPYMRTRMNDAPSYAAPVALGEVMTGETVGVVERDRSGRFKPGDIVRCYSGWQSAFVAAAAQLSLVDQALGPVSTALGVLGMPGLTAYAALEAIAKPQAGETIVIGAAAGPVGALAGQLARLRGLHTVGIAGGADKCRYVTSELGFNVCLDRRQDDMASQLGEACPNGVDIYMELTGGQVLEAVLPLMNLHGRIPVIGIIAWYNASGRPEGADQLPDFMRQVLYKRLHVEGMIVSDLAELRPAFEREVSARLKAGEIVYKEDIVEGLANAPDAFIGLLEGRNFGKLLVKI